MSIEPDGNWNPYTSPLEVSDSPVASGANSSTADVLTITALVCFAVLILGLAGFPGLIAFSSMCVTAAMGRTIAWSRVRRRQGLTIHAGEYGVAFLGSIGLSALCCVLAVVCFIAIMWLYYVFAFMMVSASSVRMTGAVLGLSMIIASVIGLFIFWRNWPR